jgi:hypothetical protein
MRRLTDIGWVVIDRIFPSVQPRDPDDIARECERRAAERDRSERIIRGLPSDRGDLREYLSSCKELLAGERERRQGVEARLTTILGFVSVASTIVFGSMLVRPQSARSGLQGWALALVLVLLFYLTLQVYCAIRAAVCGLGRRGYGAFTSADVLPTENEAPEVHLRRQITNCLKILDDDRVRNNEKVTQMAVAHEAMKNFLGGLLVLAIVGTWRSLAASPHDDLVERLRQDHALQEVLRGPQGFQGVPGPQGPPGVGAPARSRRR